MTASRKCAIPPDLAERYLQASCRLSTVEARLDIEGATRGQSISADNPKVTYQEIALAEAEVDAAMLDIARSVLHQTQLVFDAAADSRAIHSALLDQYQGAST